MSEVLSTLDPRATAFLTLDIQTALVGFYAKEATAEFVQTVRSLLACARDTNATVIHVRLGFRQGFPEVSERNRLLSSLTKNPDYVKMLTTEWFNLHPALEARPDEPVLTKSRISAFEGTDLKVLLRSKNIDTLVLFGIITSGVVLSTALEAMDQDYRVLIVRDACVDSDPELHACLLDHLLAKRTDVVTAAEIVEQARHHNPV
jgi:nicotinamidase-related amidase